MKAAEEGLGNVHSWKDDWESPSMHSIVWCRLKGASKAKPAWAHGRTWFPKRGWATQMVGFRLGPPQSTIQKGLSQFRPPENEPLQVRITQPYVNTAIGGLAASILGGVFVVELAGLYAVQMHWLGCRAAISTNDVFVAESATSKNHTAWLLCVGHLQLFVGWVWILVFGIP